MTLYPYNHIEMTNISHVGFFRTYKWVMCIHALTHWMFWFFFFPENNVRIVFFLNIIIALQCSKETPLLVLPNRSGIKEPSEMRAQRSEWSKWAIVCIVLSLSKQELSRQKWLIQRILCTFCTEFDPTSMCNMLWSGWISCFCTVAKT